MRSHFRVLGVFVSIVVCVPSVRAVPTEPHHLWSEAVASCFSLIPSDSASAADGSTYLTGQFRGCALSVIGGTRLSPIGDRDIFLIKLSPDGHLAWAKSFGSNVPNAIDAAALGAGVAVDANGDVVLAGYHLDKTDFGGGEILRSGFGDKNVFVAKFDSAGNHLWSADFGHGEASDVAVDAAGNVLVTGWSRGIHLNPLLGGAAETNVFVMKLDPDGVYLWSVATGGRDLTGSAGAPGNKNKGYGIAADSAGNVIATGDFEVEADFGNGPLTGGPGLTGFIVKLSPDGAPIWTRSFDGLGLEIGTAVTTVAGDGIVVTGTFRGLVNFGGDDFIDQTGDGSVFLAKFSAGGAHHWSRKLGATEAGGNKIFANRVAADADGNVWLAGHFTGSVDLGFGELTSTADNQDATLSTSDDFFLKVNGGTGASLFSRVFGDGDSQGRGTVTVAPSGNVVMSGIFEGTIDFGGGPLTSPGFHPTLLFGDSAMYSTKYGIDDVAPVIAVPETVVAEATSAAGAEVTYAASAQDETDGALTPDCAPASGDSFALGTTIVACTAHDQAGNSSSASFDIVVRDTRAPSITVPPAISKEATGVLTPLNIGTAVAADAVDATPIIVNDAPAAGFPVGGSVVRWAATDHAGNSTTALQTVTVTDTTAPSIAAPANVVKEATAILTTVALGSPTVSDIADPHPVVTADSSGPFGIGTHTVVWTATDASGNAADAEQTVRITDTTPPVLSKPADVTVTAAGPLTSVNIGSATGTDIFGPVITAHNAPAGFPIGTTEVTWTARDANGNVTTAVQLVRVQFAFGQFLAPLEQGRILKQGQTIPVKFQAFYATGALVLDARATIGLQLLSGGVPVGEPLEVQSPGVADSGDVFRLSGDHYAFNLSTKSLQSGTYRLSVDLHDGSMPRSVDFSLK